MSPSVSDINVAHFSELPSPNELIARHPRSGEQATFMVETREQIHRILFGDDPRLLVVVGPCSIHDTVAGREYAERLAKLSRELEDRLYIVMRVYFEKPRTSVGWKGLIMDPKLDGSYDIASGLATARDFLQTVIDLGLPTATELLDPITPQYIADLVSWSAIGARTTESQTHRQMASGLSMPLGFKNGTGGDITLAVNAIKAASHEQTFLGVTGDGRAAAVTTRGNPNCHLVLRGGRDGPNYDSESVRSAAQILEKSGLTPAIMVDCSHANSSKDPSRQPEVAREIIAQIRNGEESIIGIMLESNLVAGNQKFPQPLDQLTYGQSITDGCISWEETDVLQREIHAQLPQTSAV